MQKSILYLDKKQGQTYHAIFKNNHGRRLYIQLQINNNEIFISDCFYTDRHARNGIYRRARKESNNKQYDI